MVYFPSVLQKIYSETYASYTQGIALKPDFVESHSLGTIFYGNGDVEVTIESLAKANDIYPKLRISEYFKARLIIISKNII